MLNLYKLNTFQNLNMGSLKGRFLKGGATLAFLFLLSVQTSYASHMRYLNLTWKSISGNTVEFKFSYAQAGGNTPVGSRLSMTIFTGDGRNLNIPMTVTSNNVAENYFYSEGTAKYTYASPGNYTAFFSSCCRINGMVNNSSGSVRIETTVNVGSGNSSPVATLPPVVNISTGVVGATFTLPANDPDGDQLSYRLANRNEMGGGDNPAGLSVDSHTGLVTFNTKNASIGQLYSAAIVISDGKTNITVDFIIKITQQSTAPELDYLSTPRNGTVYQVAPGQSVNFNIKATDSDAGDIVTLSAVGMPNGASTSPALPTSGNPVSTSFSWVPSQSNLGSNVINFIAQDRQGVQKTTSVIVQVSLKPVFDVPPTPASNLSSFVTPGTNLNYTIQASDPDLTDFVQIVSVSGLPAGASLSSPLPTAPGNPTSTNLIWSPAASQWGSNAITFTAKDTYGDQTNHKINIVVNNAPKFISSLDSVTLVAGQLFTYNIQTSDIDVAFGDELEIVSTVLPSWLTLTDNGNGTATLSGTPQISDAGNSSFTLMVEDLYHHDGGLATQALNIKVVPCNTTLAVSSKNVSCPSGNDGSIDLIVNGGVAPFSYAWSNGASVEDPTNLVAGTYSVVVTDKNDCKATISVDVNTTPDVTAPLVPVLADVKGECSATATAPLTTDSCSGTIIGTTTDALTYTTQGTHVITWSFKDGNGNISTATQNVIIKDITAPVVPVLANVIAECSATVAAPTTSDNCAGTISGTTADALTYTSQGTHVITWNFNDGNGNVTTATQNVIVKDITAPASPVLADVIAECSATVSVPTTTDNCTGTVTGTTSNALTYTTQGSYVVTWSFNDGNGNVTTATQNVLVKDLTAPVALAKNISVTLVNGAASITAASIDNGSNDACGIQSLAIDKSSFDCSNLGNNTVVLTVTDKNGNVSSTSAVVNVIGVTPVASIAESRSDNTFTGLNSKTIALGYGAQKLTLTASNSTSASNATTYVWSPAAGLSNATIANPVFTPTAAGTYTFNVIATNEFGCSASASITINVIDVRSGNKGDKVLVCHKAGNNKWTQISIGASAVNTHLLNGGYLGACDAPATIAAASINDLALTNNLTAGNTNTLSAYPNPFAGQTTVTFTLVSDQAKVSLDLYDLKGVKVKSVYSGSANALQAYSFNFDGSSIPSGVYFFKLTGNNLNLNFKVIVAQ